MGLFVCNRLILQARPHKLNKRGNWVLIKSQEWGCVKDTTTPTDTGVKSVWLISRANSLLAQGAPHWNPLMSGWRGNPFPFIGLLHEGQWEERWLWALASPNLPTALVFKQERLDCYLPPFASVHIWLGNTDGWPVAQLVEKVRNPLPETYVFHEVDLDSYSSCTL